MTRKKVALKWVESRAARKASFRKRREGVIKKMHELSVLCGVDGCIVVQSPDEDKPQTWPPTQEGVENVMERFFGLPKPKQTKHVTTLEGHMTEQMTKMKGKMRKKQMKTNEMEMSALIHRVVASQGVKLGDLGTGELEALSWFVGGKEKECDRGINILNDEIVLQKNGGEKEVRVRRKTKKFLSNEIATDMMRNSNATESGRDGDGAGGSGHSGVVTEIPFI